MKIGEESDTPNTYLLTIPLLGDARLESAAFREDALRQRATFGGVLGRVFAD